MTGDHRLGRVPETSHTANCVCVPCLARRVPGRIGENMTLPDDYNARKLLPMATGVLDYFPKAIAAVAHCSLDGNNQHNPGEPLHWAREKSTDEANTLIRHFVQRGTFDANGVRHSAKVAWRALALLEKEIEADGGRIHGLEDAPAPREDVAPAPECEESCLCLATSAVFVQPDENACTKRKQHYGPHANWAGQEWPNG